MAEESNDGHLHAGKVENRVDAQFMDLSSLKLEMKVGGFLESSWSSFHVGRQKLGFDISE